MADTVEMTVGQKVALSIVGKITGPSGLTADVRALPATWTSSNPAVASLDTAGPAAKVMVTANTTGTATITATFGTQAGTIVVEVGTVSWVGISAGGPAF